MPITVHIHKSYKLGGDYTVYTLREARDRGISYHTPPLEYDEIDVMDYVLTSNDYVVPIIKKNNSRPYRCYYMTPFGKSKLHEFQLYDGRTQMSGRIQDMREDAEYRKLINLAWWHARQGDIQLAYRMAYGHPAPPEINDIISDQRYQIILHSEFDRMVIEEGFPKGFIVQQRMEQTESMTKVMAHIQSRILNNEEIDPTHIELFVRCFKAQEENVGDLEKGYVRTPVESPMPLTLEESYTRRAHLPGAGFHKLQEAKSVEDAMSVPVDFTAPDGFAELSSEGIGGAPVESAEEEKGA